MSPARKNTDDRTGMDPDMPLLRADLSRPAVRRTWRGLAVRGGGQGGRLPSVDEFFGTSTQVCGRFWPFAVDMALPVEGCTGRPVAHDRSRGVLRSDQLVPCRHHRTAQHVRDGTAGHRQINVRPPTGVGHGRSWRACDYPRRSEARLRGLDPAAWRAGHPSGFRDRFDQPARPGRHPHGASTAVRTGTGRLDRGLA